MKESGAWLLQAKSDLVAAQAVLDKAESSTYCQAIAKYQQAVEKSVKGIVAFLEEQGIQPIPRSHNHTLSHEINSVNSLRRNGLNSAQRTLVEQVNQTLQERKLQVEWLSGLAPSGSRKGIYSKNTEYPFNDFSPGGWTAPAVSDVYTLADVTMAENLAKEIYKLEDQTVEDQTRRHGQDGTKS